MQNFREIGPLFMKILHFKELENTESVVTNAVLVIDNCMYPLMLYPFIKFKAIGQLAMDILYFKDLGDTESVVTNAVILVLGECQISKATYQPSY